MRRAGNLLRVAMLGFVVFLSACAGVTPPASAPARPERASLEAFTLEGRISVRREGQNFSGQVAWQHRVGRDDILLSTPLGQGVASLVGGPEAARLELADKRSYLAPDVDTLSEQIFGARLPLSRMPLWVLGRTGGDGRVEWDDQLRPARIMEQGWQIDYLSFESPAADALPTRLLMQRGDLEVRLAIDSWTLDKP